MTAMTLKNFNPVKSACKIAEVFFRFGGGW
jgi:hypothetical protein